MPLEMNIEIEHLIEEVKKRKGLYDPNSPSYNERDRKKKLWDEICIALDGRWTTYKPLEKTKFVLEIKKRWHSLRDCFRREVSYQSTFTLGDGVRKKAKYKYYDALTFLLPFTKITLPESYNEADQNQHENENSLTSDHGDETFAKEESAPNRKKLKVDNKLVAGVDQEVLMKEDNIIKITSIKSEKDDINDNKDDVAFLMSLLPSFKDITTEEKFLLRIELMQTIMRFKASREISIYPEVSLNEQKYDVTRRDM